MPQGSLEVSSQFNTNSALLKFKGVIKSAIVAVNAIPSSDNGKPVAFAKGERNIHSKAVATKITSTRFSALPAQMRMVLLANLAPLGLSQELLIEWFPQASFTILDSGQSALSTNLQLTDGTLLKK